MPGAIVQVNVSPGGIPKRAVALGRVSLHGIEGDSWAHPRYHGGPAKALLLLAAEVLAILRAQGFAVYPGALGENLTTEGLEPRQWRTGQIYRAGSARLELTQVRVPCRTLQVYGREIGKALFDARVRAGDAASPLWALSGMYARVLSEGIVRPGDAIVLEAERA